MLRYPISIQEFAKLRQGGFAYVDKTELVYRILTESTYYFLSRPRRFGKSLLLNTIKEVFLGNRALFQGLWIEDKLDEFDVHPVVKIHFEATGYKNIGLPKALNRFLTLEAEKHDLALEETTYDLQFNELIEKLHHKYGKEVVLLIDEYDKPITDYLENMPKAKENRETLKSFYSVLKQADQHLRLVFITGVSRFSRISIFSELNNLDDLTGEPAFSALCGYTQAELEHYFSEPIRQLAKESGQTLEQTFQKIKEWYDGYNWGGEGHVYNPFSLLSLLKKKQFDNYWFSTGTPTFLVKLLNKNFNFHFEGLEVDSAIFEAYQIENIDPVALLFQTGYLSIKERTSWKTFILDYPNKEVEDSLKNYLLADYANRTPLATTPVVIQMARALDEQNLPAALELLHGLFKDIPAEIFIPHAEAYYHSIVHLAFSLMGQYVQSEVRTSDGRMDAVVQAPGRIYLFEFKLDKSADAALQQVFQKDYAAKFALAGKPVTAVGVNFSSTTKGVEGWKQQEVDFLNQEPQEGGCLDG